MDILTVACTMNPCTEFDFAMQAMYTVPSDQSAWLYHRWLMAQSTLMPVFVPRSYCSPLTYNVTAKDPEVVKREIKLIQELLDEEPDSKCG